MKSTENTVIVGGGLSGLTLAYLLSKKGKPFIVLEAADRLGGRIQTVPGSLGTPLELGATWFSDAHGHLLALIDALRLAKYPQHSAGISLFQTKSFEPPQRFYVPASESPSYRIAGGTQMLINRLAQELPGDRIYLNTEVSDICQTGNHLRVTTVKGTTFEADRVVVCLPPRLAAARIRFSPALPPPLAQLLPEVHTWMAGAVKFTLEYNEPFWRKEGYSGMLYSHAGLVTEMYDHTNFEENRYALTGFLNGSAASYSAEVRKELVLQQLSDLLGPRIMSSAAYFDKVWNGAYLTHGEPAVLRPHQNNGHPALRASYTENSLFFCSTETAAAFHGYMEGAVIAAGYIAGRL